MNLAIRGIDANLGERDGDTFTNDQHKTLRADYILANPPFNIKDWGQQHLIGDSRWQWGTPPALMQLRLDITYDFKTKP